MWSIKINKKKLIESTKVNVHFKNINSLVAIESKIIWENLIQSKILIRCIAFDMIASWPRSSGISFYLRTIQNAIAHHFKDKTINGDCLTNLYYNCVLKSRTTESHLNSLVKGYDIFKMLTEWVKKDESKDKDYFIFTC